MKKTFAAFFVLCGAALPAFCASTCETRVDGHQNATTRERVAYCLTPEAVEPAPAGPEVIYYGVSSNKPEASAAEQTPRRKETYFDKDGVAVSHDYVDTKKFPVFTNDRLSEQDRWALEQAQKEAWAKAQEEAKASAKKENTARAPRRLDVAAAPAAASAPVRPSVPTEQYLTAEEVEAALRSKSQESAQSLAARRTKPKRFMKASAADPAVVEAAPAEPAVATDTPPAQLQEAYALENNPLSEPADGAAPEGFLDDDLMTGESFGYNASDPALQP